MSYNGSAMGFLDDAVNSFDNLALVDTVGFIYDEALGKTSGNSY